MTSSRGPRRFQNRVGEIGDCIVFVGNLIVDFNYEEMSRVLRVLMRISRQGPQDASRQSHDHSQRARRERVELLGRADAERFHGRGVSKNPRAHEPLRKGSGASSENGRIGAHLMSEEWLFQRGKPVPGRQVKDPRRSQRDPESL